MKYAVMFRTHYWSDYLHERLLELKGFCPNADVFVVFDSTNEEAPEGEHICAHSVTSLTSLGLYLPESRALWYCGDYPFYDFYLKNPYYDFYLMIENDVYIDGIDFDKIIENCLRDGVDIIGAHFHEIKGPVHGHAFSAGRSQYNVWRKCFFPVVGLRRAALLEVFSERLRQRHLKDEDPSFEIPFCETFVGSEAEKRIWKRRELGSVAPVRTYGASKYMLYDKVSMDSRPGIWHSVLPADRYISSCISLEYKRCGKNSFTSQTFVDAIADVVSHAGFSVADVEVALKKSTFDKVNRALFEERIDAFVLPSLGLHANI